MTKNTVNPGPGESADQQQPQYPASRQLRKSAANSLSASAEDDTVNNDTVDNDETSGDDYVTQGTKLPVAKAARIRKIKQLRKNSSDIDAWCAKVRHALVGMSLEGLINNKIPRPTDQDLEYKRWKYWTMAVSDWLYGQVDKDIKMILDQNPYCATEADILYQQILDEFGRTGKTLDAIREIKKWDDLKRSDYASAAEFIRAYKKQYNVLKIFKLEMSPLIALVKLMRQIQNEVEKVMFITEQIGQNPADELTDRQLRNYLHDLATYAEFSPFEGPANATKNNQRKKGKSGGKGRGKGKGQ